MIRTCGRKGLQVSGSMFEVLLVRDLAEVLRGVDAAVIVTRHRE